jgi:nitroreductase
MQFEEVVLRRRMVRNFAPDPVDPAVIDRIVNLALHAPSAGFSQGQAFVVVTRPDLKQRLGEICGERGYTERGFHPFISGAPVLVVPCTSEEVYRRRYREPDKLRPDGTEIEWPVPYWHMDIGCAVMILLLAAVDEGLAAGFAGGDTAAIRAALGIPEEYTPVGVIPVGHRAPDVPSPSLKRGRKPTADVIHYDGWQAAAGPS